MDSALAELLTRAYGLGPGAIANLSQLEAILAERGVEAGAIGPAEPGRLWDRHILDSLACLPLLPRGPISAVDVGSGAGLPGLVVAIARPDVDTCLLDSRSRRCEFMRTASDALGVRVEVVCQRAEDHASGPGREHYDIALARAVAPPAVALELCLPLVRVGGRAVLLAKEERSADERARIDRVAALLGGDRVQWTDTSGASSGAIGEADRTLGTRALVADTGPRGLLVAEKTSPTPERFPRRSGIPAKRPLR